MKTKALTASEVAQKILAMFPPTSKYTPNETDVFDKDGHAVVFVKEMPSGCSKVSGRMIGYKTYNQLKASEKKAFVANIESLKGDFVTSTQKLVRSVC